MSSDPAVAKPARSRAGAVLTLRCPRCREGKLFLSALRMRDTCPHCGLTLEPEPGFYLGSIYANYALTVLLTTLAYLVLVFGYELPKQGVLAGCVLFTMIFPVWFFRYARAVWLTIMYSAGSQCFLGQRTDIVADPSSTQVPAEEGRFTRSEVDSFHSDDGVAGGMIVVVICIAFLVLVSLMIGVVIWTMRSGAGS